MPDRRRHRGAHPGDAQAFAPRLLPVLRCAVEEFAWLRSRQYAEDAALKLVGDRYELTARQRLAVRRSACTDAARDSRQARQTPLASLRGADLAVDGYNLLITIESALSGGLILVGRDGCCRDLASVHGTYRKVSETLPAIRLIAAFVRDAGLSAVDWHLDRPVSNSGRLRALIAQTLARDGLGTVSPQQPADPGPGIGTVADEVDGASRRLEAPGEPGPYAEPASAAPAWTIELTDRPDAALLALGGPVATSDSAILDRCGRWVNLAREIIAARVPAAWCFDLSCT